MNQNTNTIPQPHPWVTEYTPDNLRDPQLLQDLSEIGMTCLLGWHTLHAIPHSYKSKSEWYHRALDWVVEMERLNSTYGARDEWIDKLKSDQPNSVTLAFYDMLVAYHALFMNTRHPGVTPKTVILQRLMSAHNIIRHLVKGVGGDPFGKIPMPGESDFLDFDPATRTWIAPRENADQNKQL